MKTLSVGELKRCFSEVLQDVASGEHVAVAYGRKHVRVAVLVPYDEYVRGEERHLGILEGRASYRIGEDFAMTDEEMVGDG